MIGAINGERNIVLKPRIMSGYLVHTTGFLKDFYMVDTFFTNELDSM